MRMMLELSDKNVKEDVIKKLKQPERNITLHREEKQFNDTGFLTTNHEGQKKMIQHVACARRK